MIKYDDFGSFYIQPTPGPRGWFRFDLLLAWLLVVRKLSMNPTIFLGAAQSHIISHHFSDGLLGGDFINIQIFGCAAHFKQRQSYDNLTWLLGKSPLRLLDSHEFLSNISNQKLLWFPVGHFTSAVIPSTTPRINKFVDCSCWLRTAILSCSS